MRFEPATRRARARSSPARARHLRSIVGISEPGGRAATRWELGARRALAEQPDAFRRSSRNATTRTSSCRSRCACCATSRTLCARRLLSAWAWCCATPRAGRRRRGARAGSGRRCRTSSAWRRTGLDTAGRTSRCAALLRGGRPARRHRGARAASSCPQTTRYRTCAGAGGDHRDAADEPVVRGAPDLRGRREFRDDRDRDVARAAGDARSRIAAGREGRVDLAWSSRPRGYVRRW